MIALIWPPPISNLITTNKLDTDIKINEDLQYFATLKEQNNSAT